MANPFKPTFGTTPPILAGRKDQIQDFADALEDGPGAAGRATLYTGARGAGKTVMLNAVGEKAASKGWLVVNETATGSLIETLTKSSLPSLLQEIDSEAIKTQFTGFSLPVISGGITWQSAQKHMVEMDLRRQINLVTDLLAKTETGLLITVDEVHKDQTEQLRELATVVQHAFREERQLAFAAAGLTSAVKGLLDDDILTFLRRADRHELGSVNLDHVREAILLPIESNGRKVEPDALETMIESTGGYPFLIQLVGSHCWKVSPSEETITLADAEIGTERAHRRLGALVHEPALAGLSEIDRSYLLKMAEDDGPSRTSDITKRLDVNDGYGSMYRERLIAAEVIEQTSYGYVDFTLPYLRDYLREHAASMVGSKSDRDV